MSYGRHQSFYLKRHWINKGIKALNTIGDNVLFDKENYVYLGIGKNMHQSLRYWLESSNIITVDSVTKKHNYTNFGQLCSEYDPSAESNLSKNLIHFYLCQKHPINKTEISHTFYWYFNFCKEDNSSKERLRVDLLEWDDFKTSEKTISKDIDCLISLYTNDVLSHPEDKNVSLLSDLGLITKFGNNYVKSPVKSNKMSLYAFMYILLKNKESGVVMSIENILTQECSIGKVFNLNRTMLIDVIEDMIEKGFKLEITRTNNLDTIKIKERKKSENYLKHIFENGDLNEL
ncbi:DUF4007 family protein [Mycoplasmatota bacterium zrk1]